MSLGIKAYIIMGKVHRIKRKFKKHVELPDRVSSKTWYRMEDVAFEVCKNVSGSYFIFIWSNHTYKYKKVLEKLLHELIVPVGLSD